MPKDKSLFHYGKTYHNLIDPLMKPSRDKVVEYIPISKSVLDIGCGTGELSFELRKKKQCQVVGVDLSLKMINFAKVNNHFSDVQFVHQDATDLVDFQNHSFDYAAICFIIHELNPGVQQRMVKEAWRVAQHLIFVDSYSPLPWNMVGIVKRVIEIAFGFEHYPQFSAYISSGGIMGILEAAELDSKVKHQELFSALCNQIVVASHESILS
jgi:ubiquinone/menaquinone biosynthesis C-methylase UbiE